MIPAFYCSSNDNGGQWTIRFQSARIDRSKVWVVDKFTNPSGNTLLCLVRFFETHTLFLTFHGFPTLGEQNCLLSVKHFVQSKQLFSPRVRNPGNVLPTSRNCQKYSYQCGPWFKTFFFSKATSADSKWQVFCSNL